MADNVSALPSAMQSRRTQLVEEETPVTKLPPSDSVVVTPPQDDPAKVTISRDEFNDLQAAAGKARAAEGRAESLSMDVEALTRRLTDLETASKGISKPALNAPAAPDWEPLDATYSDKEMEDYGESKGFVTKAVNEALNGVIPKILSRVSALESIVNDVKSVAEGASKTATSVRTQGYTDRVKEEVAKTGTTFDDCVNHKHWADFTQSTDPDTGFTYVELIKNNVQRENVAGMVRVFKKFCEKYGVGEQQKPTGYEGVIPNSSTQVTNNDDGNKMLPFSERKEAHRKFINKEISYDDYKAIQQKFEEAGRNGLIDYDK